MPTLRQVTDCIKCGKTFSRRDPEAGMYHCPRCSKKIKNRPTRKDWI